MKLRRNFFFPTWKMKNSHVGIVFSPHNLSKLLCSLFLFCTFTDELNIACAL